MNPGHKQKKSKEPDAPQWYIDAYLDALQYGSAIVLFRNGQEPEHIPVSKYTELKEAMTWRQKQESQNAA